MKDFKLMIRMVMIIIKGLMILLKTAIIRFLFLISFYPEFMYFDRLIYQMNKIDNLDRKMIDIDRILKINNNW